MKIWLPIGVFSRKSRWFSLSTKAWQAIPVSTARMLMSMDIVEPSQSFRQHRHLAGASAQNANAPSSRRKDRKTRSTTGMGDHCAGGCRTTAPGARRLSRLAAAAGREITGEKKREPKLPNFRHACSGGDAVQVLRRQSGVGWAEARNPTIRIDRLGCWASYLSPTYGLQQVLPLAGEQARQAFELVDADQYPRHGGEILQRIEPDA